MNWLGQYNKIPDELNGGSYWRSDAFTEGKMDERYINTYMFGRTAPLKKTCIFWIVADAQYTCNLGEAFYYPDYH